MNIQLLRAMGGLGGGGGIPAILKDGNTTMFLDFTKNVTKDTSNAVSEWQDTLSIKKYTNADNTKYPIWTPEGVYINNTNQGLQLLNIFTAQPIEVFALIRQITWGNGLRIFRQSPTSAANGTLYQNGTFPQLAVHTGSAVAGTNGELPVGDWGVINYLMSGTNSFLQVNKNTPVTGNFGTGNVPGLSIGTPDGVAGSSPLFLIKKLILRKKADTETDRNIILDYLIKERDKLSHKMVSIGDSITLQNLWQPTIAVNHPELAYNSFETITGVGTYPKMGFGSSKIVPLITTTAGQLVNQSIYERADYVKNYYPTTILLLGGVNDLIYNSTIGTIDDPVYTSPAVSSDPPSFYSAYKGTLKKLTEQNPKARVICLTPFFTTIGNIQPIVNAVKNCANLYGVQCLDLLSNVPINASNHATYLSDGVHPNALGGELIGNYIASQI